MTWQNHWRPSRKARAPDLIGIRVGRLVVVRKAAAAGRLRWICRCDCGRECVRFASSLKTAIRIDRGGSACDHCLHQQYHLYDATRGPIRSKTVPIGKLRHIGEIHVSRHDRVYPWDLFVDESGNTWAKRKRK